MTVNNRAVRVAALVLLSLTLVLAGSWPARSVAAEQGAVTSVPYQGRLTGNDGQAVADGVYAFTFALYSAESGGEPLWAETQTAVTVQDGYFSVLLGQATQLDTGIIAQDRYLSVAVRGPEDDGFTTLEPRQKLTSPQATLQQPVCSITADHDHWGETWSGSGTGLTLVSSNLYGFFGRSSASSGVFGRSDSTSGTYTASGVYGLGAATSTKNYGVYGQSYSTLGRGVWGHASATSGATVGVLGRTDSSTNTATGVVGIATAASGLTYGVAGETQSSSQHARGVYGIASSTTGDVKGVIGETWSTNGGVAVVGTSWGARHAGWFESMGNFESVQVRNNGTGYSALWVNNLDTAGPLIGAGNGTDTEFWLDGTGNLYIDGTLYENQGDMADMLPAVDGLEPGDVLIIGLDGRLARSSEANQTSVAGIYSTDPGIVGRPFNPSYDADQPDNGSTWSHEPFANPTTSADTSDPIDPGQIARMYAELDEGYVPLAMAGVVPVKVSAENGPIRPGDLLTTSSLAGHAMKATPVELNGIEFYLPGTIMGKAMGTLEEGTGMIYALVTLQ
jgi:hypothetical protein